MHSFGSNYNFTSRNEENDQKYLKPIHKLNPINTVF